MAAGCPREYEAQIFEYGFGWAMEVDLSRVRCPIKAIDFLEERGFA